MRARYDGLADWYEAQVSAGDAGPFTDCALRLLGELAGRGRQVALDIGCGTGVAAPTLRDLGWAPVGVDLSADQLRLAAPRLPVALADAASLPVRSGSVALACTLLTSTDIADFTGATREVRRVLEAGGRWVLVAVHPCFHGAHAERLADGTIRQHPGYRETGFSAQPPFNTGVRSRVGAWHRPLAELVDVPLSAGFVLDRIVEAGPGPMPGLLGLALSA